MKKKLLLSGVLIAASLFSAEAAFAVNPPAPPHVLNNAWYKIRLKATIPKNQSIRYNGSSIVYTQTLTMDSGANNSTAGQERGCYINLRQSTQDIQQFTAYTFCAANHSDVVGWEYVAPSADFYVINNNTTNGAVGDDFAYFYLTNQGKSIWHSPTEHDLVDFDLWPNDYLEYASTVIFTPNNGQAKGSTVASKKGFLFNYGNDTGIYGGVPGTASPFQWIDGNTLPPGLIDCADAVVNDTELAYCNHKP